MKRAIWLGIALSGAGLAGGWAWSATPETAKAVAPASKPWNAVRFTYDGQGKVSKKEECFFDGHGNLVKRIEREVTGKEASLKELESHLWYTYDSIGAGPVRTLDADGTCLSMPYSPEESPWKNLVSTPAPGITCEYDGLGNLVKVIDRSGPSSSPFLYHPESPRSVSPDGKRVAYAYEDGCTYHDDGHRYSYDADARLR